ncbi:Bcr/CflA family drug resistance efflux transporter [Erwinia sp. OLTSP20]|uniref:multidrug effflux MFS transporter n=1 Tax=unclassified Erwinia TaxID=2622719 RepID=UPI000C1853C3|nr:MULTISPECIES: multidrug effflux MFS transporter [unclassified Erwinia]PIJ51405.1 Bcr/CflA family drug resistance efflux transporter [Erwinia sp. OAMSP11]PIJ73427.1 Bcr/CflA family drug resistance efflux transporter [Erwinia sp. OLSSP12]PIJ85490.1 Bcr/CflA family drug resistance efflux transporter [Erwinia sp. OLCASP19]PIJ85888.1 Bcr/CflA family drug resistance efflux transporter [Erwinia sp. OLMTSP26]PIJ87369.1 Bcr/CflA family drug resistance efflux transporter [Erwinia sp. OLMDSP33]
MQKFTLLLLTLVLFGPLGIDLYLPVLPAIANGLHSPISLMQLTIPLFLLIMGLGQLVAGPLVDNLGRKPVALTGIALYLAGSTLAACAPGWQLFFVARVVQGCAVCCTAVVAFSGVRDRLAGDDAARAYSFLNGALNIVPALAPLLGGLLGASLGWRAPFWLLSFYALIIGLLVIFFLPETRPSTTLRSRGIPLRQYSQIIRRADFLLFAAANAGVMGMVLTYVSLAPEVLMNQAQLTPLQFSFAFGANGLWIMLFSMVVNKMIRKVGRPACLLAGALAQLVAALLLLAEITLLPVAIQHAWFGYMLPVVIACAGLAWTVGPATSYALEPWPQQAGVASALMGFIQMAGGAAVGMLVMALPLSEKVALLVMMALAALLCLLAWRMSKKMRGHITAL